MFIKWRSHKFKQSHFHLEPSEPRAVKEIGVSMVFGLIVSLTHLYGIFILDSNSKTVTYFLIKVTDWWQDIWSLSDSV